MLSIFTLGVSFLCSFLWPKPRSFAMAEWMKCTIGSLSAVVSRQNKMWYLGKHPGSFSLNRAIKCDVCLERKSMGSPVALFLTMLNGVIKRRGEDMVWLIFTLFVCRLHLCHFQTHLQLQMDSMI